MVQLPSSGGAAGPGGAGLGSAMAGHAIVCATRIPASRSAGRAAMGPIPACGDKRPNGHANVRDASKFLLLLDGGLGFR
jgi:hypothetical protein